MAVVAPPPLLKSKLDLWESSESAIYPAVPPSAPMTDIMSYQYPPPPQNGADMDMSPSGYYPNYSVSSHTSSGMDSGVPSRDRSDSMRIKRSLSTPAVGPSPSQAPAPQSTASQQSTAQGQDPLGLAGEKRRNKLGYHRTSVACGHCRRRKIRCIPSQNDVQGRCMNCIRLKKDCSFFPVDQQPPPDTRQKSASRSSVGPKIASASSSPAMQSGMPSDMHGQQPYSQLTIPSMPPPMKPAGSEAYTPDTKIPSSASSSRAYDYGQSGITNWMADASPSSSKPSDLSTNWRTYPAESPITPAFSPYTPHAPPPSATWSTPVGSEPARDDLAWSSSYPAPPPRSLSFGAESVSSQSQYPSISHVSNHSSRDYSRKASSMSTDMYPAPISTAIPGVDTTPGSTPTHGLALSAGAAPSSAYGTWQQPYPYSKPSDGYGGAWVYQESGHPGDQHSTEHAYYER
ncbi:hypothetical protein QC763_110660 [Podospora pseudopauciseta]|uniref:Zn(2)-C6 fungal-type domain-containing protein n=1 Tax=Podospora pseudopauciseta TaxID=2093780 RepID=A0ABR0I015_9PEZI|nr:hypothetical protein QC763_110660 [Podospora pseudopauciseta]